MNLAYLKIKNLKDKELSLVDKKIKEILFSMPTEINPYFENFLFIDAKRLRPLFIFLVCDLLNLKIDEDTINLAVSIELLHSASLIHDDILDNGELRRNQKCLHLQKGYKMAILAGDYLLSLSMKFLSKINVKVLDLMAELSYVMTRSEINALNKRFEIKTVEDYILNSKEKTASLFIYSLKAIEKIKDIKIDENIFKFTENFALCFQIKDDINNCLKQEDNKISDDEKEGIYTLPLLLKDNYKCGIIDKTNKFLSELILESENLLKGYNNSNLVSLLKLFG